MVISQTTLFDLAPLVKPPRYHDSDMPGHYIYGDAREISLAQLGGKPFRAIIADPPWEFRLYSNKGNAKVQYDLLTLADICAMPIGDIAAPDSVLFLWATNPLFREAMDTLDAWGFEYKTKFPWVKTTEVSHSLNYGTGYWVRGVSEDVIIATRGNVPAPRLDGFLGLIGPNIEHSRKPQSVHYVAESTTPGPYLELFGRYQREGWVVFGNENRGQQPPDPIPSIYPPWLLGERNGDK
jgi:N6-adenosine-specific RNA methylase IME4